MEQKIKCVEGYGLQMIRLRIEEAMGAMRKQGYVLKSTDTCRDGNDFSSILLFNKE